MPTSHRQGAAQRTRSARRPLLGPFERASATTFNGKSGSGLESFYASRIKVGVSKWRPISNAHHQFESQRCSVSTWFRYGVLPQFPNEIFCRTHFYCSQPLSLRGHLSWRRSCLSSSSPGGTRTSCIDCESMASKV